MISRSRALVSIAFAGTCLGGCALLYDFGDEGTGGAITAGTHSAASSSDATGDPTTTRGSTTTDTTVSSATQSSSSTGDPWTCATMDDCFGAPCDAGSCAPRNVGIDGVGWGLHVDGIDRSVSVIYEHTGMFPGTRIAVVPGDAGPIPSANIPDPALPLEVAFGHHQREIVAAAPLSGAAYQYFQSGWGARVDTVEQPPTGTGNHPLSGILFTEYGWVALAGPSFFTMIPAPSGSWSFTPVTIAGLVGGRGHDLAHHLGIRYVFSVYDDLASEGCIGVAEHAAGTWTAACHVGALRRASGLASNGKRVAVRLTDALDEDDVVATWEPGGALTPIARTPFKGRTTVAIDSTWVYFDGAIDGTAQALFRCRFDADPDVPPQRNDACETILDLVSPNGDTPAVTALGSARLDQTTAAERSLVCWMTDAKLTCQVLP